MNISDENKKVLLTAVLTALLVLIFGAAQALGIKLITPPAATQVDTRAINFNGILCDSGETTCVDVRKGSNIVVYSDDGTTQKFKVAGASGNTTIAGTLTATGAATFSGAISNTSGISTSGGITLTAGNVALANGSRVLPQTSGGAVITNTTPVYQLVNTVARTDTSNKLVGVIPANAQITDVTLYYGTASDAGTTATLSCGKTSGTPTEYVNAANVKAAAGLIRAGSGGTMPVTSFGGIGASDVPVYCKYAETGGASTTGGPFTVIIAFAQ